MIKLLTQLLILFFCSLIYKNSMAQSHDFIWTMGYNYLSSSPEAEGLTIDFGVDSFYFQETPRKMYIETTNAMYSDSMGGLELYTNGCVIASSTMDTILNGDGLNPGLNWGGFCNDSVLGGFLNVPQYGFFLQNPTNKNQAYLFQTFVNFFADSACYSICEKDPVDGDWAIIEKNTTFHSAPLGVGGLMATKHANGRDWWLVVQGRKENKYYSYLFDENGISPKGTTEIGIPILTDNFIDWSFSPDGQQLAIYDRKDDLRLFDFDRCSGQLSNPQDRIILDTADMILGFVSGCAWSHNGQYLYVSNNHICYQFDMWDSDWKNTLQIVGRRDLTVHPFSGAIGYLESGPDGRIYSRGATGSSRNMHVIWNPEKADISADFRHGYYEPAYPIASIPMFPNYRLGPIDGSSCDTLGLDNHPMSNYRYDRLGGLVVDFTEVCWYETDEWAWDFGDPTSGFDNTSDERYPTHVFSAPGVYQVCLTAKNGNGEDIHCKEIVVYDYVSTDALVEVKNDMLLYPNPTSGLLNWRNLSEVNLHIQAIKVFDSLGRLRKTTTPSGNSIDLSALSNGLYRLVFFDEKGNVVFGGNVVKVAD